MDPTGTALSGSLQFGRASFAPRIRRPPESQQRRLTFSRRSYPRWRPGAMQVPQGGPQRGYRGARAPKFADARAEAARALSQCAREPRTSRPPELSPPGTQRRLRADARRAAPRAHPRYRSPSGPWHGVADAHHGTPRRPSEREARSARSSVPLLAKGVGVPRGVRRRSASTAIA